MSDQEVDPLTDDREITKGDLLRSILAFKSVIAVDIKALDNKLQGMSNVIKINEEKAKDHMKTIKTEIKNIKEEMKKNDEKNSGRMKQMEERLSKLKEEMLKVQVNKECENILRQNGEILDMQPQGIMRRIPSQIDTIDTDNDTAATNLDKQNEAGREKECDIPNDWFSNTVGSGTYKSTWAKRVELELEMAAGSSIEKTAAKDISEEPTVAKQKNTVKTTDSSAADWLDRKARNKDKKKKRLKRVIGDETEDETDPDTSSDEWSEIDRRRRNKEKKKRA